MFDLIIKNGKILDGTGNPYYRADIAVKEGKIARVGKNLGEARRVIDAAGLTVTPGFIDSHSHSDSALATHPELIEKVEQGITTSVGGQCGGSMVPDGKSYTTMGDWIEDNKETPFGANQALLIGHGTIRRRVIGPYDRDPSAEELDKMCALVRDAMEHGALGMSFGLFYSPGCYAKLDEEIALAKVVGEYHGVIAAHIRDEAYRVEKAVEEFLAIVRASGARGVISHHKACYQANWGTVKKTLKMIDDANDEGLEVYCDVYPYNASNTSLSAMVIPARHRAFGDDHIVKILNDTAIREEILQEDMAYYGEELDWVMISSCQKFPQYGGRRISEIAAEQGKSHYDTAMDIIRDSNVSCSACYFSMCEEDVETVMRHPRAMIGTDAGVARNLTFYHPRLRGTFPRVLGRFVRERGVTTLPEMIRKITSMPAQVYGFKNKGLIHEGFDADICIFDADTIIDRAEFTDPTKRAEGLNYVLVGGEVVAENAVATGAKPAKLLLRE